MRKLTLSLDDLVVESFATGDEALRRGTVVGNAVSIGCDTINATCDGAATCGGVAENTCALSCDTCDQYRCGTIDGYDCTNAVGCASGDGQCNGGGDMTVLRCP